jgi:hypothetical protein
MAASQDSRQQVVQGGMDRMAAALWVRPLPAVAAAMTLALSLAAPVPVTAAGDDHSQHADHAAHQMSAEDLATLRRKIPLYQQYTDEEINQGMARMADLEYYVSPEGVRDEVGILALGHGYKEPGNTFFRNAYEPIGRRHPVAAGLGMAMMSSDHIQTAVDRLEKAGAKTIVAIPTEVGDDTSLIRQWHYIFGLTDESAYLDVPRVKSKAKIVVTKTPTTSPVTSEILAAYARSAVRDPAKEVVLLVAHGPEDAADNAKLMKILEGHAARVKAVSGVREVRYDSLQDDATTEVREANVKRMRDWISAHGEMGHRVIVLQVLMTGQGGVTARLRRDFDGLNYDLVDKGLAEHPLFNTWIEESVREALASAP